MAKNTKIGVRISSAAPTKPTSSVGFRFMKADSAKKVPMKYVTYKPPKLIKGASRWYVEYYYLVPKELQHLYKNQYERFRVFENINRYKSDEYAKMLLKAVEDNLERGFNPFYDKLQDLAMNGGEVGSVDITIKDAFTRFIEEQQKKGLDPDTVERYTNVTDNLYDWFKSQKLGGKPVELVKTHHIKRYLEEKREEKEWSNRQYNNIKSYIYTLFNFLKDDLKLIKENPVDGIKSLKVTTKKHRYFDNKLFPKVTSVLKNNDPYLWYMVQFVYYLAVRSNKELRALRVRQIVDHGEYFRFEAETSKSSREDLIPVDPHLREVMEAMGLMDADPEDYIFTRNKKPGPKKIGEDWITDHWANIRKAAGLSNEYTVYGFKHTRAVHLLQDRVSLADISKLFRHTDIATTAKYARDLGVDFDASDLLKKSRKI